MTRSEDSVPEAFTPPPGNPRFPLFDGLRAIAALTILGTHTIFAAFYTSTGALGPWTANLDIGVPIFFVISGFLLYRPFVSARSGSTKAPTTTRFYRRRLLRIVPAYWVALTVLSIYPLSKATFDDWPKYYFFLQSYTPSSSGLGQAWSLCVEVSFYLLLPVYAYLMLRLLRKLPARRRIAFELAVLALLSLVSAWFWSRHADGETVLILLGLPHYLYWFALGMALALLSVWGCGEQGRRSRVIDVISRHSGLCWAVAIGLFIVLGFLTTVPRTGIGFSPAVSMIRWGLQPLIAALLVLPAVFQSPSGGLPARLLTLRPVAWLGLISYGIYLWHLAVVVIVFRSNWIESPNTAIRALLGLVIVFAIVVPLAAVSYYVVERPFLRLKDVADIGHRAVDLAQRKFAPLALSLALLCGAVVALVGRGGGLQGDDFPNLIEANDRGLGLDLLFSPIIGERLSPGHRVLDWVILQAAPYEWVAALGISALCLAAATILVAFLVRQLTGSAIAALLSAAFFGTWVGWVRISLTWSGSAHALPGVLFTVAAMICAVSWDRHRRRRDLAAALATFAAALSFGPRWLIAIPILLVVLIVAQPSGAAAGLRGALVRFRATLPLFGLLAAVALAFLLVGLSSEASVSVDAVSAAGWLDLAWRWVVNGAGAIFTNTEPAVAAVPLMSALGLVGLSLLAAATIRNRRSAAVWLSAVMVLVLCGLQVGYSRLGQFGLVIISELRYHEGDVVVLAILVPCAWWAAGKPWPRKPMAQSAVALAMAIWAVAWVANAIATEHAIRSRDPGPLAATTLRSLRATLPPLVDATSNPTLIDDRTPSGFAALGDRLLPGITRTFTNVRQLSTFDRRGTPILVSDDGIAREVVIGRVVSAPRPSSGCLKTAPTSTFLGRGSAGAVAAVDDRAPLFELSVLSASFTGSQLHGQLGIVFKPSKSGLPDAVIPGKALSDGLRIRIPPGTSSVVFSAWGGFNACFESLVVNRGRLGR